MPLTEHQLSRRPHRINASELAALIGMSKWPNRNDPGANRADAILRKISERRGEAKPQEQTYAQELGHAIEPFAVAWAAEQCGLTLAKSNVARTSKCGMFACTLDAVDSTGVVAIDAKTSGLLSGTEDEEWGDPDEGDSIPLDYLVQFACDFYVVPKLQVVLVPAYLRRGKALYTVRREDTDPLIQYAIAEGRRTWDECIVKERIPTDLIPSVEVLRAIKRKSRSVTLNADLAAVADWRDSSDAAKKYGKLADAAKELSELHEARVLKAMGDADTGVCEYGTITVKRIARKGYAVEPGEYTKVTWKES